MLIATNNTAARMPFHGHELGALGEINWDAFIKSGTDAVSKIGPALIDLKTQDKIAKINVELAKQGKPLIDPNDMPGGIRATAGLDKNTRYLLWGLGGATLLLLAYSMTRNR